LIQVNNREKDAVNLSLHFQLTEKIMSAQSERLVADVKMLVTDTEELVKATAAQAGEKIVDIRNRAQSTVNNLKPQLVKFEATVAEKARTTATATDAYVHSNPWTAIGVSAGVGLVIGLLVGRR
jgi:ElaB/YqjD/DUF883 family membrane-anchored ribosome-binding protein